MRRFFFLLCLLAFFSLSNHAQTEQRPLLALHDGAIYAIDVATGESEMLVPAPSAYEAMLEFVWPITIFSENWLSPDGQFLTYAMTYPVKPAEEISENSDFIQRFF